MPERYITRLEEALKVLREAAKIEFDPDAPHELMREAMEVRGDLLQRGTALLNEATVLMRNALDERKARRLNQAPDKSSRPASSIEERKPAQRRDQLDKPGSARKTGE